MSAPPFWLQGPVPGIHPILQPVAHALLQVELETPEVLETLTPEQLWARPGPEGLPLSRGSASIGYHVAHLAGSLDRLFTYSRGESLSPAQQQGLAAERTIEDTRPHVSELLRLFSTTMTAALAHLRTVPEKSLFEPREVGRGRLPSNTLGLLFHAAEHSIRHGGQILTLARVVKGG